MAKKKSPPAFQFVIDEFENSKFASELLIRPMFGAHALYLGDQIIFILRQKGDPQTIRDDGLWVVTTPEHIPSLTQSFPQLREIEMFKTEGGKGLPTWWNLPANHPEFEETALALCALVKKRDPRIGKVPVRKKKKTKKLAAPKPKAAKKRTKKA